MNDSRESNLTATPYISFHRMEYEIVLSALLGLIIVVSLLANILVCFGHTTHQASAAIQ